MSNIKDKLPQLGDKVKDRVTGFEGVVVGRTEWLNGCVRLSVQPEGVDKDKKVFAMEAFDEHQLVVTKANHVVRGHLVQRVPTTEPEPVKVARSTGGPMPSVGRGPSISR